MDGKNIDKRVYAQQKQFLAELRERCKNGDITKQQLLTLKGQALNGDADGAVKGLAKIVKEVRGL